MTNNIPRDPSNDVHIWLHKADIDKQYVLKNPILYMIEPTYYDPRFETRIQKNGYAENVMCINSANKQFSHARSIEQAQQARELLLTFNVSIILGHGREGQLDGVFTRDAGLSFVDVIKENNGQIEHVKLDTLTANFCHHKRHEQKETEDYMSAISFMYNRLNEDFKGAHISIRRQENHLAKGDPVGEFGDFMYVPSKDILVAGHRPAWATAPKDGRTDRAFHDFVAQILGLEGRVLPIEVANGYYHADTSSKHLPNNKVVAFEGGMSAESFTKLRKIAGDNNIIKISAEDAAHFGCNLLVMDNENIITAAEVSNKLVRTIEKTGIKVHKTPLSQFTQFSGGGINCMTNPLNNMRNTEADYDLPSLES